MKKLCLPFIALLAVSMMFACGGNEVANGKSDVVVFGLDPSDYGVGEFLELLGERNSPYDGDVCHNVTPKYITDKYDISIFKFEKSCEDRLLYDGELYELCEYLGGFGVTSFAIADLDKSGGVELYFTYSWGSCIHWSQAGYFDTDTREVTSFDYGYCEGDMTLVSENSSLELYGATVDVKTFVDITMTPGDEKIGDIVFGSDGVGLLLSQDQDAAL